MKGQLCKNHWGYPASEHPANIMTWFTMKEGHTPAEIVYPANHPPELAPADRKKLRQSFGVTVRTSDSNSPLALAGPIRHVE